LPPPGHTIWTIPAGSFAGPGLAGPYPLPHQTEQYQQPQAGNHIAGNPNRGVAEDQPHEMLAGSKSESHEPLRGNLAG
jgi:hypothetical protein